MIKNKSHLLSAIMLLTILVQIALVPKTAEAVGVGPTDHQGGIILLELPCTCTGGFFLVVWDVGTKLPYYDLFQAPFSSLKSWYTPIFGNAFLAGLVPGGFCAVNVGPTCVPIPMEATIDWRGLGTSLVSPFIPK